MSTFICQMLQSGKHKMMLFNGHRNNDILIAIFLMLALIYFCRGSDCRQALAAYAIAIDHHVNSRYLYYSTSLAEHNKTCLFCSLNFGDYCCLSECCHEHGLFVAKGHGKKIFD